MKSVYQAICINCAHKFYAEVCFEDIEEKIYCPVCGGGVELEEVEESKNSKCSNCKKCIKK